MIKVVSSSLLLAIIALAQTASGQILKLSPLPGFGTNGDGSIRPGERDYLTSSGQIQRSMAWNPVTGHILSCTRTNANDPSHYRIGVDDGIYGTNINIILANGLVLGGGNGSFLLNMIGVADDGAIYGANLSNQQIPSETALYRWADENTDGFATIIWTGDPANGINSAVNRRWGDTFAVRGAGMNTQILMASRGTVVCLFAPFDESMTTFTNCTIQTDTAVGALGYGLTFGAGNTFWGTSGANGGGPLLQVAFDLGLGTATTIQTFNYTNFSGTVSPISVLVASNWLAGVETRSGADMLKIYNIAGLPNPPVLNDRATWFTNNNNNTFSGAVAFTTNNLVYALDGDNGIMAFTISSVASNTLPPSITLQPASKTLAIGSNSTFTAAADGEPVLGYQWQYKSITNAAVTVNIPDATNNSLSLTNLQLTNSGSYTFIASNAYGMVTSLVASLIVASAPQAFYEPFAYAPGSLLAGQGPGSGAVWNPVTGPGGSITNLNLSYPGLPASTGNAFVWGNVTISERIPTGTNLNGNLYFSFLFRADNISGSFSSDTIAGFGEATNSADTVFDPKINIAYNSGSYQLGVYKGTGTTLGALAPTIFAVGDTVFVVGNYNFVDGLQNDTVNMWLNPDPSTFGAATPPPPTVGPIGGSSGTDMTQLSHFFFRSTQAAVRKIADEVRVGYTWADVTPLAPPSLAVARNGTNAVITWPSFYSTDFVLQGRSNLVSGTWASLTNVPVVSGTNWTVTVPLSGSARFFRLIK